MVYRYAYTNEHLHPYQYIHTYLGSNSNWLGGNHYADLYFYDNSNEYQYSDGTHLYPNLDVYSYQY